MILRPAKESDFEEFFTLESQFNKEHSNYENPALRLTLNKLLLKKNFLKKLKKRNKLFIVLDDGAHLQGYFVGLIAKNKMAQYGYDHAHLPFGYIENVFITKSFRRKGYFSQMMDLFFAFLKKKNCTFCELNVNSLNVPALKVYEHYGFVHVEHRMLLHLGK